jgi:hypothetical protein
MTSSACYARSVLCEDLIVNGVLSARAPLALSTWLGRTGLSELPRLAVPIDWGTWSRRVRIDAEGFRGYANAVHTATAAFVAGEHCSLTTRLLSAVLLTRFESEGQVRRGQLCRSTDPAR